MFKESRRKIVAAIMSVLVLLWVGTLSVIYSSSYYEMKKQNERMLQTHAEMYTMEKSVTDFPSYRLRPDGSRGFNRKFNPESPRFQLSTFYSVALSYEGEILKIENGMSGVHSDGELGAMAQRIVEEGRIKGTRDNLAFYKTDKNGYILVAFMDNTVVNENALTLFRYTLIFGAAALILFFFLSVFLAKKIVDPLEEGYHKQKQFISDAGHELKTPVSVVSANAELLSREIGENQWLSNILYENERMGILVGQLLELARTESIKPETEEIDFSRLVQGEALPFESVAFENGVKLVCNIESGLMLEGNSTQLKQLVSILLDNSIRHGTHGEGVVNLRLIREHGFARLSVINTGEEIPENHRKEIFERFYRIDTARNSEDKHYGLGLAIAKSIVDSHKGRIEVLCYNSLVEFCVHLPLKQ